MSKFLAYNYPNIDAAYLLLPKFLPPIKRIGKLQKFVFVFLQSKITKRMHTVDKLDSLYKDIKDFILFIAVILVLQHIEDRLSIGLNMWKHYRNYPESLYSFEHVLRA